MAAWGKPKGSFSCSSTPRERYDHASYLLALIARHEAAEQAAAAKRKRRAK